MVDRTLGAMASIHDPDRSALDPKVTRCVCMDVELATLTGYASVEAIKEDTGCGTVCGLCLPYLVNRCRIG